MNLQSGKTIAVMYRRGTYGEPDYLAEARQHVLTEAGRAQIEVVQLIKRRVELENHCTVVLIDEVDQDVDSRGYSFVAVYVMPRAGFIGEGIRRSLTPGGEIHEVVYAENKTT